MPSIPPPSDAALSKQSGSHLAPAPEPDRDEAPWPLWTAPAAIVAGFALGEFFAIIIAAIGASAGSSFQHPTPAVSIISDVAVDLSFVAAALYFSVVQRHATPASFGFRRIDFWRGFVAFAVAGISYYVVTFAYAAIFNLHGSDKLPSELGVSKSTAALAAAAVFVCAVAPMAEEFFFRGFLFGALRRMKVRVFGREIGTWIAAIITGILFGLAHTGSASSQYLIPLGFLGFVLCLVRWRTGSLYPCMALHSFNNSLALGVNELHWSAGPIIALIIGSMALIAAVTWPLSRPSAQVPS
ncbi:MAG TPA: CPBP family intramembrane glutamic endopeptidase [Solirubrobacteraceae bacterium]|nr:CPBP family intramembrane glutamic endopeptidase [Solirubrobacteraceae bacterium]